MDFLETLLALLGGGTTSDRSHVGAVVLLATWTRPTLGEDETVSVLLIVPIELALLQSGGSTALFSPAITLSSKQMCTLMGEYLSAEPNRGYHLSVRRIHESRIYKLHDVHRIFCSWFSGPMSVITTSRRCKHPLYSTWRQTVLLVLPKGYCYVV